MSKPNVYFPYSVCERGREYLLHHVYEDERGLMLRYLPIDRSKGVCEHLIELKKTGEPSDELPGTVPRPGLPPHDEKQPRKAGRMLA